MSWSVIRNVLVYRWVSADRMLLFLRPKRLTNVIFRGALLVLLPMLAVIMLCVWLCRHVSNISAGIRHLPIFVPHRLYWPLWLLSMRFIMVPNGKRIYSPVLLTYQS